MNPGWIPADERAATLTFDRRAASARLDASQNATERKQPDKSTAASLFLRFLYWIYERRLLDLLKRRPMPRHIGIILDGNRRHARKRGLSDPCEIYQRGAEKLNDILDWSADLRIPALTLWVFSTENLKRTQAEVSGILSAIEAKVAALAHDPFMHQLPSLAERAQRVLLYRRVMAGISQGCLPPRHPCLSGAQPPLWPLTITADSRGAASRVWGTCHPGYHASISSCMDAV